MEEVSSRRSSNDEYGSFSSSLMEPTAMHDVMSLEMSHSMADNYLDPRSFGDGGSFDEFGGQVESRYEADNGYEQPVQQRSHYSSHQQGQPLPPPGSRFDHHATNVRTAVPTYPVKTVDPNTSTQFAPARIIKPPRIRHSGSRSSQKKEPMDPKTVEDEVARNVSQILSATKQQKLAQEAQQRCGIVAPVSRINFSCSDCGKTMTSHRNLQRHRQTSCCRKVGEWVDRSQSWPDQWNEKDPMSEDSDSLPGMGAHSLPHSSFSSESSGWCSPNNSYSPSAMGSIDMGNMLPLSLDTDDSHTHSSSASHCSNSSTVKEGSESFMCDACKKTVCSLRSLKRHHTTCKQFITEFGPPQDGVDVVPVKQRSSARRVKPPNYTEDSFSSSSGGISPERQDYESEIVRHLLPRRVPADSTQNDDDRPQKQILAANTCADCNRQLCSASNLKRHRATCKMALTKGEVPQPVAAPAPPPTFASSLPDLPVKDRNIIDRSYAAAVAASEHVRMQAKAVQGSETPPPPMVERPRQPQQYTAYIVTSPRTNQKPQPYVTVGEHLRAKHVQQKLSEPTDEPQGAVLIQNNPAPNAPLHNQIVQIKRPSLVEKAMPPPSQSVRLDHNRPTHVTVIKSDSAEIPPLESIITTQPLSGGRVTGVPVLVHDSRQQGLTKAPAAPTAEFQCPECKKTYSCRKNVKRHRMAVHKITSEDISRWPGPAPCPHAHIGEVSQLSPSLPRILLPPRVDVKADFKTETIALSPTVMDKGFSQDVQNWHAEFEDSNKDVGLKRHNSEVGDLDEKKSRPELAEADTTFNEDKEFGSSSHHSSPGIVSSTGPLPSLASWMCSRPLSVEIPYGGTRSAGHSPLFKSRRFELDVPSSFFSHDDGLPLDPMLGHGPSSAPRELDDDAWYKQEEMPDSTTCQRLDRSTSPGILMESDPPPLGTLPYTRKRALSGGSSSSPVFSTDPKQIRHQCQACGKFYSSEWNLERHRRESCQTKVMPPEEPAPVLQGDEISILIGSCRFVLPRSALTKASTAFTSLFQIHDPAKGELRLEGDPMDFQNLLDVYNDPLNLTRVNVDSVLALAEQYKFVQVTDTCAKFICDELSKMSLMHAIRLADQHKLLAVKIRLFSSISIEVFRALNSDRDYQMMSSELKAELLEKWGTFL